MKSLRRDWLSNIRNDLLAGLVVALALIPEAIATTVDVRQRYGELDETLAELETDVHLVVMGRHEDSSSGPGANFERAVRSSRKPILTVPGPFKVPARVMIAFDGGIASRRGVEMVATSPMFCGCTIFLLMSGKESTSAAGQLEWARQTFETAGLEVNATLAPGSARVVIADAARTASADLLVMGAYSHSPLRSQLLGSQTTELLRAFSIPTLLMR